MDKEYALWGLPAGSTDKLDEKLLYTRAKTTKEIERVQDLASTSGWHSFRVQILQGDGSELEVWKQHR